MHIRRNDTVQVVTGVYKATRGRVLKAMPSQQKVIVEGVNLHWKHVRPSQRNPRGGRLQLESPIHVSNVMLLCPNKECERFDKPVRVRCRLEENSPKMRVCAKCGAEIPKAL